jgi:NADPH:quinone reductase
MGIVYLLVFFVFSSDAMLSVVVHEFGDANVLKVEKVNEWNDIGSTQVVVRVESFGVNPVDTYIRSGQYARLPV